MSSIVMVNKQRKTNTIVTYKMSENFDRAFARSLCQNYERKMEERNALREILLVFCNERVRKWRTRVNPTMAFFLSQQAQQDIKLVSSIQFVLQKCIVFEQVLS
jgi:hypothetical protein